MMDIRLSVLTVSTRGRQRAAEESIVNAQNAESRARNKYDDAKAAVVRILHVYTTWSDCQLIAFLGCP